VRSVSAGHLTASLVRLLSLLHYITPKPLLITGYDGKTKELAIKLIRLYITLDGRRIYNLPFVILPLGKYNCIIGIKFLRHFEILLDSL
jgi:hypothetical protein